MSIAQKPKFVRKKRSKKRVGVFYGNKYVYASGRAKPGYAKRKRNTRRKVAPKRQHNKRNKRHAVKARTQPTAPRKQHRKTAKRVPKREPDERINRSRWRTLPGLDTVTDHSGDTNGRALPGRTIRDQISRQEKIVPKRAQNGHLYRTKRQRVARTKKATMYLLVESSDNTFAVHESLYETKKEARTPAEWADWFARHSFKGISDTGPPQDVFGIIKGSILDGMKIRTGKDWSVVGGPDRITLRTRGYLGFQTHDLRKPERPKVAKKRRKAKRKGRKNG